LKRFLELKALEVQEEDGRQFPDLHLLPRVDPSIALRAEPALIASEVFWLNVFADAISDL